MNGATVRQVTPLWIRTLHRVGTPVAEQVATARDVGLLFVETLRRAFRWPWRWNEIALAVVQMGIGSLPIIALSTAFAGLVVTNEIAYHMDEALHTITMIPGFTGQFILRELGIAIPALLLVAKVGASTTAEVGSMKVTEQIDALKLLGIDPIDYLVFPRFVACIFSIACLTLISIGVTLACAISVAVIRYNFSILEYLNALRHFVGGKDLVCALIKGMVFGAVIPIVSCAYGFRCKGGAEGVGTATTNAVVASTIVVIVLDFVLTFLFTWIL
jgi:phospholipid/cholesterol/gamma-HCH transport system permease protein